MRLTKLNEYSNKEVFPPQFSNEIYLSDNSTLYFEYRSVFSIKFMLKGSEIYQLGNEVYELPEDAYLLVNQAQDVAVIPSFESDQAMSVFLEPALLADVYRSYAESHETLAENPFEKVKEPKFLEKVYRHPDDSLKRYLHQLFYFLQEGWKNEIQTIDLDLFFEIARQVLISQQLVWNQVQGVDAVKRSTKEELFRRASYGRDFIADNFHRQVSLNEVAREACLSPHHFHRIFRKVFNLTPLQFMKDLKMKRACLLLQTGNFSVTEVAGELGYCDVYTFSKDFKKVMGVSPGNYQYSFA